MSEIQRWMQHDPEGNRDVKIFLTDEAKLIDAIQFPNSEGLLSHLKLFQNKLILVKNNTSIEVSLFYPNI